MDLSDAIAHVMCVHSVKWPRAHMPSHYQTNVVTRGPGHLTMWFWWMDLRTHWGQVSRRQPDQMLEPPQLAAADMKGQRLYSELPLDVRVPQLISVAPSCPVDETHFGRLYSDPCLCQDLSANPERTVYTVPTRTPSKVRNAHPSNSFYIKKASLGFNFFKVKF